MSGFYILICWAKYVVQINCKMEDYTMKAAVYMRVGNKDQLEPETDDNKKEQEFENYCERLKHCSAGMYIPPLQIGKDKKSR